MHILGTFSFLFLFSLGCSFASKTVKQTRDLKACDKIVLSSESLKLDDFYEQLEPKVSQKLKNTGVPPENIKGVQRLWIRYRDAWVNFASKYYPQVSAESIKARLTEKRIGILLELLGI